MQNNLLAFIILLAGVINFVTAFYLLILKPRTKVRIIFAIICLEIGLWNIANYISIVSTNIDLIKQMIQLSILPAILMPISFLYFALLFTKSKYKKHQLIIATIVPLCMIPLVFTSWNVKGYLGLPLYLNFIPGPLYLIFTIYFLIYMSLVIYLLTTKLVNTKLTIERQQIYYIISGLTIASLSGIICSVILPLFLGLNDLNYYGNAFSITFGLCTAYAITRYRLFGIIFLLRKTLLQILVLVLLSLFYILLFALYQAISKPFGEQYNYVSFILICLTTVLSAPKIYDYFMKSIYDFLTRPKITSTHALIQNHPFSTHNALEQLIQAYCHLKSDTHTEVYIFNPATQLYYAVYPVGVEKSINLNNTLITYLALQKDILIIEELEMTIQQAHNESPLLSVKHIGSYMREHNIVSIIPLHNQNVMLGFVFIKSNYTGIKAEDVLSLRKFQILSLPIIQSEILIRNKI